MPPFDLATAPSATRVSPEDRAERRQVMVMFSDLVGPTALSARMDPEDLREVISAYQKCVAESAQRFGGFVAKYMGDGVPVYFGYPQAHEDDAERAVTARRLVIATRRCFEAVSDFAPLGANRSQYELSLSCWKLIDDAAHASDDVIDGKRFVFVVIVECNHQMGPPTKSTARQAATRAAGSHACCPSERVGGKNKLCSGGCGAEAASPIRGEG